MARLPQLRRLSLGGTRLASFPEVITALTRLTYLRLVMCGLNQLPESLCRLYRLTELFLGHNGLATLPESLAELQQIIYVHLPETSEPRRRRNVLWNQVRLFLRWPELFPHPGEEEKLLFIPPQLIGGGAREGALPLPAQP